MTENKAWALFKKRRKKRLGKRVDAKDDEGRWITTENNHRVHLNEEGEPDKGNPHVIEVMESSEKAKPTKDIERYGKTPRERKNKRESLYQACIKGLSGYRPVLKAKREILQSKKEYVRQFDEVQKELSALEGVTKNNLEEKKKELDMQLAKAREEEQEAIDMELYDDDTEKCEEAYQRAYRKRKRIEASRKLLDDFEFNKERLESVKKNRKSYDLEYEQAKKEYESAKEHMHEIVQRYNKQVDEMNATILAKYPDNDSIESVDDAEEYILAKGIIRPERREREFEDCTKGEPKGGNVSLSKCNIEAAKSMCRVVDKLFEKFPEMSKTFGVIKVHGPDHFDGEAGYEQGGTLALNSDYFCGDNELTEGFLSSYHPKYKSSSKSLVADSIFAHEVGHVMDEHLCRTVPEMADGVYYAGGGPSLSRYVDSVAPKLLARAARNLGISKTDLKESISGYACKNDVEAFAEAFSEYMISEEPRPAAREIGRQIESLYRTGKLSGREKKK